MIFSERPSGYFGASMWDTFFLFPSVFQTFRQYIHLFLFMISNASPTSLAGRLACLPSVPPLPNSRAHPNHARQLPDVLARQVFVTRCVPIAAR